MPPSQDEQPGQTVRPLPWLSGNPCLYGDWGFAPARGSEEHTVLLFCRHPGAPHLLPPQFHCAHCSFPRGAWGGESPVYPGGAPRKWDEGQRSRSSEAAEPASVGQPFSLEARPKKGDTTQLLGAPCAPRSESLEARPGPGGVGADSNTHSQAPLSFAAAGPGAQASVCPWSPVYPGRQPLGLEAEAVTGVRVPSKTSGLSPLLDVQTPSGYEMIKAGRLGRPW